MVEVTVRDLLGEEETIVIPSQRPKRRGNWPRGLGCDSRMSQRSIDSVALNALQLKRSSRILQSRTNLQGVRWRSAK
jgi:hypothetical protein